MKKIFFCFGTRPEAIKMLSLVRMSPDYGLAPIICLTGQHREMIDPLMDIFGLTADFNLKVMANAQGLSDLSIKILAGLTEILERERPDAVCVQGDTTSTFAAALAAFYLKIPVIHIEAGLRTHNKFNPFPEEMNRKLVSSLADLHFPPTPQAQENLRREGVEEKSFISGNTSIDALALTLNSITPGPNVEKFSALVSSGMRLLLLTSHRRENLGVIQENIFSGIRDLIDQYPDTHLVFPVHLNPQVQASAAKCFANHSRISLIDPLDYPDFVHLMNLSYLIFSDSGGIQEEAPHLGRPVLVLRETTERPEGIEAGVTFLVGTSREKIFSLGSKFLSDKNYYSTVQKQSNPYGDGKAYHLILSAVSRYFDGK